MGGAYPTSIQTIEANNNSSTNFGVASYYLLENKFIVPTDQGSLRFFRE